MIEDVFYVQGSLWNVEIRNEISPHSMTLVHVLSTGYAFLKLRSFILVVTEAEIRTS